MLCTPDLTLQHSTVACTHKMTANKKINGTEAPKKKKNYLEEKLIHIINKHDAGITDVKISHDRGVHATMFRV